MPQGAPNFPFGALELVGPPFVDPILWLLSGAFSNRCSRVSFFEMEGEQKICTRRTSRVRGSA